MVITKRSPIHRYPKRRLRSLRDVSWMAIQTSSSNDILGGLYKSSFLLSLSKSFRENRIGVNEW